VVGLAAAGSTWPGTSAVASRIRPLRSGGAPRRRRSGGCAPVPHGSRWWTRPGRWTVRPLSAVAGDAPARTNRSVPERRAAARADTAASDALVGETA